MQIKQAGLKVTLPRVKILNVLETSPVNLFGYWKLLRASNSKRSVAQEKILELATMRAAASR